MSSVDCVRKETLPSGVYVVVYLWAGVDGSSRYGDVRPAPMQKRTWKMVPFNPEAPGPYVTFIFRYRSKGEDFLYDM